MRWTARGVIFSAHENLWQLYHRVSLSATLLKRTGVSKLLLPLLLWKQAIQLKETISLPNTKSGLKESSQSNMCSHSLPVTPSAGTNQFSTMKTTPTVGNDAENINKEQPEGKWLLCDCCFQKWWESLTEWLIYIRYFDRADEFQSDSLNLFLFCS